MNSLKKLSPTAQTEKWIRSVVVGNNFCPFAAAPLLKKSLRFVEVESANLEQALQQLSDELQLLQCNPEIETTLIIFTNDFSNFGDFLALAQLAESITASRLWRGVFQTANFHPDYVFDGASADDAANYTNRSIYPMLHILRESSLTNAVDSYPDADAIPERNINRARVKGVLAMAALRAACLE